jgi:glycosyltransferase involved in cell wall biosynthesis
VEDGDSGFLVHPRDTEDLSKAMLAIARTTPEGRRKMGAAGRALVEAKYDERFVIQAYQDTLKILTLRGKGR